MPALRDPVPAARAALKQLRPTPRLSFAAAAVLALAAPAAAQASLGPTGAGSAVDYNLPGVAQEYKVLAGTTESVNRLSIYLDKTSTASKVDLGLYSNAKARLGHCVVTAPVAGGWNRCFLPAAVSIKSGTTYWTAILQPTGSTGTVRYRNTLGTGKTYGSWSSTLTALPGTWASGADWGSQLASVYADKATVPTSTTSTSGSTSSSSTTTTTTPPPPAPAAPTASFSATPTAPATGQAVTFDGSASTCAATPCTYTWEDDGPDGPTGAQWPLGTGSNLSFTFSGAGTKYVRLKVTDAQNRTATVEHDLSVSAATVTAPAPAPDPTPTPDPAPAPAPAPAPTTGSCTRTATTATFASQLAAAAPGEVLCLASGDYGTFTGAAKSSPGVTIRPQDGASASMYLQLKGDPASWLTLDGLTITGATIAGPTHDVRVQNSAFTGSTTVYAAGGSDNNACSSCPALINSNIVFDHNTYNNINPGGGYEGRIEFLGPNGDNQTGVTVQNSTFSGGLSDGIQTTASGVSIIGNTFTNLLQSSAAGAPHTDSIQLLGSSNTLIRGNYFKNVSNGTIAFDGVDTTTIEDNVYDQVQVPYPIVLGGDTNSIIQHNTLSSGEINLTSKAGQTSRGTIVRNNIAPGGVTLANGVGGNATPSVNDYNLCSYGCAGAHSITGNAVFTGGGAPSAFSGFLLSSTSPGRNAASDGLDMGRR